MTLARLFIGVLFFSVIVGCQTVPAPIDEYSLARAAIEAARSVQAARHSPGYWHQAEEAYRKGRVFYDDRDFARAKEQFVRARFAAEKAENSARLIRQKTGDIL
ncbi:DUF4398 domain-containing protein [Bdellovibrio sp. HCB209]|uniref:DUF4398 domain-containing protein n=1 Tax=Bdellovibrio sp. HCB209 TaxID=3394354 RepID=UPI0039B37706